MKVMLLTDIPPCRNYTAGLVLDRLVSFLQPEQIAICAVVNPVLSPEIPAELHTIPQLLLKKPREGAVRILPGRLGDLSAFPFELMQSVRVRYALMPQIIAFAKQQRVDAIWVVLQGQTMVRLARKLSLKLNLPLLTQVWDPFGWWLQASRIDRHTQKRLRAEFDKVLQHSTCCATASWAMSESYSSLYGIRNLPVIASLPRTAALKPAMLPHSGDEFIIGMAGQFYAQAEWNCLIQALNQVNWTIAGKRIRIRIAGGSFQASTQLPANFEYLGWRSQEETIRLLSEADLLYMPYWFSEEFKEEASSSFPSKLVTYFAAGRPVLCHAPAYASPAKYLKLHNAAYLCDSLDTTVLLKYLEQALSDPECYSTFAANGTACLLRDFTLERMQESFLDFLNIDPTARSTEQ